MLRILILLRHFKMLIAALHAAAHSAKIPARPDDEGHESQGQKGIEVEGNSLQEQGEAVNLAALRQGGTHSCRPAGHGSDDADRRCRSINDVRQLSAGHFELIRHRPHDRTNREAVEIIVNENDKS